MGRSERLSKSLRLEVCTAIDVPLQQLGWYVRNCALSAAAGVLEPIMLRRLGRLKGDLEGNVASFNAMSLSRRRQKFWCILEEYTTKPPNDDGSELNAFFARDEFGLDDIDTEIVLLLLRCEYNNDLEQFVAEVLERLHDPAAAVAVLLGIEQREARRRIAANGVLIESGLICESDYRCGVGLTGEFGYLQLAPPLRRVMHRSCASREEWVAALIGEPLATPLTWEDFGHLGPIRELAAKTMAGAGTNGVGGINLLLHGPVGTGKTEFAKTLAKYVGMNIWSIGETDDQGNEPTRGERLAALKLAQRLLAKRAGALVLIDEAEDVMASEIPFFGRSRDSSKVYLNRMVEQNPVPIVWTCNDVGTIDPAVLRRMTLAIEVRTPGRSARARIWNRVLHETGLNLGDDAVARLSSLYSAPPAVAANAARAAMLSGGGEAAVEEAMGGVLQVLGIGPSIQDADASAFNPALVNCEEDLARLVESLVRSRASRQWSLCLYGPPGTGKSQFARHIAMQLGMEVMQQRASDLLSMWVGESEQQISAAFQAARTRNAMLVIDEADSLLSDRREAVRSWEATQVNEMLTWMESHPLPFVCTTNLIDRLDQASLRRFTLKLRFASLNPTQTNLAFECFFGIAAPRRLADGLTPGDFATVRRKRDLLSITDPSVLADWLDKEAEAKGTRVLRIGFTAGHD